MGFYDDDYDDFECETIGEEIKIKGKFEYNLNEKNFYAGVLEKTSALIEKEFGKRIGEKVDNFLKKEVDKKILKVLKKGIEIFEDCSKKVVSFEELITKRLSTVLLERVDKHGRLTDYSGCHQTRLQYLIDNRIDKWVEEMTDNLSKKFNAELKRQTEEKVEKEIADAVSLFVKKHIIEKNIKEED